VLTIFLILAYGISDQDENAIFMYKQSTFIPAIFEVCKADIPDKSDVYDADLIKWQATNKTAISRGRKMLFAQDSRASLQSESHVKKEREQRDSMVKELNALPESERIKKCGFWLALVHSQS